MSKSSVEKWEAYFSDLGINQDYIREYIDYAGPMLRAGVPPIFEDVHLSLLIGRDLGTLYAMVFGTGKFYRSFTIRKRRGGKRLIQSPYPSMLECQKWISEHILQKIQVSRCATGFRRNQSILRNASLHCKRDVLLKLDIKDFFPSISVNRVIDIFNSFGFPPNISFLLGRLCTLNGRLPQGAATSPIVSNIICKQMGDRLYSLCLSKNLRYTRYADDIAISGVQIEVGTNYLIREIINAEGFLINEEKTRICGPRDKKIVTGLDITAGKPRLTRSYRRELQRDVYFVWSAGLASHLSKRKIFNPNYMEHLQGKIAFWESIEPESAQMKKCKDRVSKIRRLMNKM